VNQDEHKHNPIAIEAARPGGRKQPHHLNPVIILAGAAFLVTATTTVALAKSLHRNSLLLSELGSDIRDMNVYVRRHVSEDGHKPAEAVASAVVDETLQPHATHQSATLSPAQASHPAASTLAESGGAANAAGNPAVQAAASSLYDSQHEAPASSERPAQEQPPVVAMKPAMPKETAEKLQYTSLAYLDERVGQFHPHGQAENNLPAAHLSRASAGFTQRPANEATFFPGRDKNGKQVNPDIVYVHTNPEEKFWQLKMSSSFMGPTLDAEMAFSSFDSQIADDSETTEDRWSADHRKLKLGSQTTWKAFSVGASYESVGKDFEDAGDNLGVGKKKSKDLFGQDTQGTELWTFRQFGNVGLKVYASQSSNNLSGDRDLPRFATRKAGSSVNYQFPSLPQAGMTLNYATGTLQSINEPAGFNSVSQDVREIDSSLYYAGDLWSGSISAANATGKASGTAVAEVQSYYAEMSYYPSDVVSISPGVSYNVQKYPEFGVSTDTRSSTLTSSYSPSPNGFKYNLYGEYTTEENRDWSVDNSNLYVSLGISQDFNKPKSIIKKWSFELFYDQYRDNFYSDSNSSGPGFMLKLSSSPRTVRRFDSPR
jgi:hypothetical protein